jgi:hypothetical protein
MMILKLISSILIAVAIIYTLSLIYSMIRIQLTYMIRGKAFDLAHHWAIKLIEDCGEKASGGRFQELWDIIDSYGTFEYMVSSATKWTFNQYFPNLELELSEKYDEIINDRKNDGS